MSASDERRHAVLHHHADLLRQRRAPYRPCVHYAGLRCAGALQAARRLRRPVPDRHGRARAEGREGGGGGRRSGAALHGPDVRKLPRSGGNPARIQRHFHPHHRTPPQDCEPGHLESAGGRRRYLSRQLCRLVLGARRGVLYRVGGDEARRRRPDRADRRRMRMGRGAQLLLPAFRVAGPPACLLRGQSRLHRAAKPAQRGRQFRQGRPAGPVGFAHDLQLGRSGPRGRRPCYVCLAGCADELHYRRRLSRDRR